MFGRRNCAVSFIARLIQFIFNDAEWLGKQQLKHCTLWRKTKKKKREDVPVGIVGCRQYISYIYTECIGNNSRTEGECRDEAQVLMSRIENVAIRRRKQDGGWNGRSVQLRTRAKSAVCRHYFNCRGYIIRWEDYRRIIKLGLSR